MKRVAIIGSALYGNKGAAAMLESSIQTIEAAFGDVEFTLYTMYPDEDRRLNPYKSLTIIDGRPLQLGIVLNTLALTYRLLPFARKYLAGRSEALRHLVEADIFLDQSGITFVDGREKFLPYNTASIFPAMNVKVPVVKCAQALGPFNNPINRGLAKLFLPHVNTIVSRGSITHSHLEDLKLDNVIPGADYAFLLELTTEEKESAMSKFEDSVLGNKKVVGISPSVVMQKKIDAKGGDYAQEIVTFIEYLVASGYSVMLVPHSVRANTDKTHNNDLLLCKEVFGALKSQNNVLFLDQELTSQELRYWIGRCDYFVASRFHAMVSSLSMAVPTLVIGWSHKYSEVLEMFELEEWAFGQDELSQDYLQAEFGRLVASEAPVRDKLKKYLPEVKSKSIRQVDAIKSIIGDQNKTVR